MKKMHSIICLLLLVVVLFSGASVAETATEKTKIQITPENFYDYFDVQYDKRVRSSTWTSQYTPGLFYDVECDATVTVTAMIPCEIYNLSFAIETEFFYYDEIVFTGNMVTTNTSFSFAMPPSGVCTANKSFEWTVYTFGQGLVEPESCGFGKKNVKIKNGYILIDNNYLQSTYDEAMSLKSAGDFEGACAILENIIDFKDSAQQLDYCRNEILNDQYQKAVKLKESGSYKKAIEEFEALGNYKDSAEQIVACQNELLKANYQIAINMKEAHRYEQAIDKFQSLGNYEDSMEQIEICKECILKDEYDDAVALKEAGDYSGAIAAFEALEDYSDSKEQIKQCEDAITKASYEEALILKENKEYNKAISIFESLNNYADSADQIKDCIYGNAAEYLNTGNYTMAYDTYVSLRGYKDVDTLLSENENLRTVALTEYTEKAIIKSVQQAMNDFGYECGTPDGIAGKKTKAAISAFQTDNGLTVTGTVTYETYLAIEDLK